MLPYVNTLNTTVHDNPDHKFYTKIVFNVTGFRKVTKYNCCHFLNFFQVANLISSPMRPTSTTILYPQESIRA